MIYLSWTIFAAGFAFAFYEVRLKDAHKASLQEIWTTPAELNALFKGKDGYYSETKGIIVDSIVAGLGLVLAILIPSKFAPMAVGGVFAIIALGIHLMQAKDWKRFNDTIAGQRVILTNIKIHPDNAKEYLGNAKILGFGDKSVWKMKTFYDFYSDLGDPKFANMTANAEWFADQARAEAEIIPRIAALAKKPESEWFREDRAK